MGALKVVLLLLATFCSTDAFCGLDKFECTSGSCINREMQCDGHGDCDDDSDEAECNESSIEPCMPEELSCTATAEDVKISKCYDTTKDICKAGGFNALCDDHEDVQHCRCDPNDGKNAPLRCPTTGECVPANTLEKFCEGCPDSVTCKAKDDDDLLSTCRFSIDGYFRCKPAASFDSTETHVCLPEAAKCDAFLQCSGSSDNPIYCEEATIKLESSASPAGVYIGDDVVIDYTLTGKPLPTFSLYHYNKEIPFNSTDGKFSYEGTDIIMETEQMSMVQMKYKITIKSISEYFYGTFDAIAWNVIDKAFDLGDGALGSFHRRVVAEQVSIKFDGVPTVKMFGPKEKELSTDIDYTWETDSELRLRCVATGKPEPSIYFMMDGSALYIDNKTLAVEVTKEYDEGTKSKEETLVLMSGNIKDTPGRYSCGANSVLGEVESVGGVKIDLIIPPDITEFNGMGDDFFFYKSGEDVAISCISTGYPKMWNDLSVNGEKVDDVVVKRLDAGATLSYIYTSETDGIIACTAKNNPSGGGEPQTDTETVNFYPVLPPTITLEDEAYILTAGDNFTTTIKVAFTESLKKIPDDFTAEVLQGDGNPVNESEFWTVDKKDTEAHIVEFVLMSTDVVAIPNIGTFKVVASDPYHSEEEVITVDVIVEMKFTENIGDDVTLNKGQALVLNVAAIAKPATQIATWKLNDTDLVDNNETIFIEESFNDTTYITTYTLRLLDIQEEQTGVISAVLTHDTYDTITDSMNLTVLAHPCLFFPCKNNATCNETSKTDYECICTHAFYTDKNCSTNIICEGENDPCENESTCETSAWDSDDEPHYKCDCLFDYDGRNCADRIEFCERMGKRNGAGGGNEKCDVASGNAICNTTYTEPDGFDCFCKHDKGGKYCDIEQLCTPNFCENDATCTVSGYDEARARVCNCNPGWQGELCGEEIPGYCWTNCNDRAYCEERGVCLCEYPFYGDTCELQISDVVVNMKIPHRAYLLAQTAPSIPEERLQKYILPVEIKESPSESCRIARISAAKDGSGDHLDFGISVTESNETTVVGFEVSGQIGEATVSVTDDKVLVASVVSISLMVVGDSYGVVSVEHADGVITAKEIALDIPELSFLKLGDFEENIGCDMALIGHVMAGNYLLNHAAGYMEGRSVVPLDACYHSPCLNGGVCVADEINAQSCDCAGTGFTGDLCEKPVDEPCDKGCLNGGSCLGGYCVCALSFHGVLCEASHEVTGTMRLSGDVSEVTFSHSDITAVSIQATGLVDAEIASDVYLLTVGEQDNSVKIMVSDTAEMYMMVVRGRESGAYEGLGTLADYIVNGTLQMTISLGEDIQITVPDGDPMVFTADELPCSDGLGTIDGLAVHGLAGITSDVTVTINGEEVMASGGMGLVSSGVDADMCAGACGSNGTCEQANNQIKCSDCLEVENQITCSDKVCDNTACQGDCTDIGECVCELGYGGDNCETVITLETLSLPVTTSSHYSYAEYETEAIEGYAAQISFFAYLEGTEQSGLLACAGNDRQYIAVKLDKDTLTVVAHCSEIVHVEASVSGVSYGEWLGIEVEWSDNFLTLKVNDNNDVQKETGLCRFDMGTTLYLGGMPDGSVPSVKATFAPADHMLPLGAKLAGGQSLGVSGIHICDTQFDPCSILGTSSCEKDGKGYKCVCNDGFKGTHCEEAKTPCDGKVCQVNEVCVEADGSCLCELPYTRTEVDNVCEGVLGSSTGFVMEGAMSYAVINTDKAKVANNFEVVFRFYLSDVVTVNNTYDLASLVYPREDGIDSYIGLDLVVGEETENQGNETQTMTRYVLGVVALDWSQNLEPNQWHVVRVQTSGMGTTLEINDMSYSTDELGIPLVSAVRLGADDNTAYMYCIGDIMINGEQITEVDDGQGVKSCSDEIPTEYENMIGAVVWAKLGLL